MFGYASIDDAEYITTALTERGNYFIVDDIAMMDGNHTLSINALFLQSFIIRMD